MAKRALFVSSIAGLVTLVGLLAAANFAGGGTPPPTLDRVSNQGTALPTPLTPRQELALGRMNRAGADVKLMSTREGQAFYRVGSDCFGIGPVSGDTYGYGAVTCTSEFPSENRPLLDMTMFGGTGPPGERPTDLFIRRSEGFAADGVASVGFRTPAGAIVGETPVVDNTYSHSSIPSEELAALVALDSSGGVVQSVPLPLR